MKSRIRVIAPVAALLLGAAPRLARPDMSRHLRVDDRVGDLLNHPAFAGFSERILPGGRGSHDENLPLRDIGSLLPYHSRVDPHEVVRGLNRMVDDVRSGHPVLHEIHSAAERSGLAPGRARKGG